MTMGLKLLSSSSLAEYAARARLQTADDDRRLNPTHFVSNDLT